LACHVVRRAPGSTPVSEKRTRGVEFSQSPNRKNHHERHKNAKFTAFVIDALYGFHGPIATRTNALATPPVCRISHRNSRSNAGGSHKQKIDRVARVSRMLVFVLGSFMELRVRRGLACAARLLRGAGRTHCQFERWIRLLRYRSAGGVRIGLRHALSHRRQARDRIYQRGPCGKSPCQA
jgi:hypothetical protein